MRKDVLQLILVEPACLERGDVCRRDKTTGQRTDEPFTHVGLVERIEHCRADEDAADAQRRVAIRKNLDYSLLPTTSHLRARRYDGPASAPRPSGVAADAARGPGAVKGLAGRTGPWTLIGTLRHRGVLAITV